MRHYRWGANQYLGNPEEIEAVDTTESQYHHADGVAFQLAQQAPPDDSEPIHAFESFVQACFLSPATDEEFWAMIAARVEREERAMDAGQVRRFEVAIDYFLSTHGLPAWTVVRQQRFDPTR